MDLNRLTKQAKRIVDQRGGIDSLKQDANELKEIAGKPGSLRDKAKAAAAALRDPGARSDAGATAAPAEPAAPSPPAPSQPAAGAATPVEPAAPAPPDQPS